MENNNATVLAKDGLALHLYQWFPKVESEIRALLLIVHGSVEHAARYQEFGQFLARHNIGVVAFDMRGHGKTTDLHSPQFAHIPYQTGWEILLDDLSAVHQFIKKAFPSIPKFVFGHSMGSFLVRDYIASYPATFNGAILSGTTIGNKLLTSMLVTLARSMTLFNKPTEKSKLLHDLIYNKLNNEIKHPKTSVDFISSDQAEVQKYLADELSGKTISIGYAHEMGKGLLRVRKDDSIKKIPKNLPILMISGKDDPLGGKDGSDVIALLTKYKSLGLKNVELNLYENARHEILNDIRKDQAMNDVKEWIIRNIS